MEKYSVIILKPAQVLKCSLEPEGMNGECGLKYNLEK